jgi:hypothetical protein
MLDARSPAYVMEVSIADYGDYDVVVVGDIAVYPQPDKGVQSSSCWWLCAGLRNNQSRALSRRAIHHLLRVTGCDVGTQSISMFRAYMSAYKHSGWWSENLDFAILLADRR